jgi:hypothetical protein
VRLAKDFQKFVYDELVLLYDLVLAARYPFVIVVSGRVARPDDKVDVVSYVVLDPFESDIEERLRRVAGRSFGAIDASRAGSSMAGAFFGRRRVGLVVRVLVDICPLSVSLLCGVENTCAAYL